MERHMETQKNPVISLTEHKINTQAKIELDGVRRSLSMLPWDLQTQQVLSFAGMVISEALLADTIPMASSGNAAQLGHASLKDLVTRPENEEGLGLEWADFSAKMSALISRQKYAIQERDFKEINALVDDATLILGHKPVDVGEFHSAKQRALQDQVSTMQREFQIRTQDIQEKNSGLVRSLTEAQSEISGLHQANTVMMQEAADRISGMTREMALNQEVFEQKANTRVQNEASRLEDEFNQKLARKQSELGIEMRDADNKRMLAESRMTELQLRIDRGELISAESLREAEMRLDESRNAEVTLRNQLLEMNSALTEAQKTIHALRDHNGDLSAEVDQLNKHVGNLEARIRDIIEDKLGSSEFAVLQERLSMIRAERDQIDGDLKTQRGVNEKQSRSLSELRGRFQQMRQVGHEHFKLLNDTLSAAHERNLSLAQFATHSKIVIGVMLTLTVISTTAMALSMSGVI
jgi:hypothetical protein